MRVPCGGRRVPISISSISEGTVCKPSFISRLTQSCSAPVTVIIDPNNKTSQTKIEEGSAPE